LKKKCPFCLEEILIDAKKCKHCREFLDEEIRSQKERKLLVKKNYRNLVKIIIAIAVVLFLNKAYKVYKVYRIDSTINTIIKNLKPRFEEKSETPLFFEEHEKHNYSTPDSIKETL